MTASQALMTSRMMLAQSSSRDTRPRDDATSSGSDGKHDRAFGDILDRANSSSQARSDDRDQTVKDTGGVKGTPRLTRAKGLKDEHESDNQDVTDSTSTTDDETATKDDVQAPPAQDIALVLAQLAAPPAATDNGASVQTQATPDDGLLQRLLNQPAAPAADAGPALPTETVDVTDMTVPAATDDAATAVTLTADEANVKVVGQETHLAAMQVVPAALRAMTAPAAQGAPQQDAPVSDDATQPSPNSRGGTVEKSAGPNSAPALNVAAVVDDGPGNSGQDQRSSDGSQQQQQQGPIAAATAAGTAQVSAMPTTGAGATSFTQTLDKAAQDATPAAQIASQVTTDMAGAPMADGSVKVLHIELKPQNLGSVSVRISLKDDVISLHLETSRHDTALAIEKERASLTSALKSAGYVVDQITTQPAEAFRSSTRVEVAANADGSGSASLSQGQSDGQSAYRQDFGDSGRRGGGQRDGGQDVSLTPTSGGSQSGEASSPARAGAIYV